MTEPHNDEPRGWVARSRDGILLILGVALIIFEATGPLYGQQVNYTVMGVGMILAAGDQAWKAAREMKP
jgi:hypothetical protein